jgi:hypothetical protein
MLTKAYDEYTGNGGYDYSSRSRMKLLVEEVIRPETSSPVRPAGNVEAFAQRDSIGANETSSAT